MYTPPAFSHDDPAAIDRVLERHPFAVLFSCADDGSPTATHVPLVGSRDGGELVLEGHMAKANPHGPALGRAKEVLVVFSGPDAYVSPSLYDTNLAVPTWNYIAVHAYGTLVLVDEPAGKDAILKRLIERHEPDYAAQWRALPEAYTSRMLGAIVGFRMRVTRVEAKFKLSQNRAPAERDRIAKAFGEGASAQRALAEWMVALGATDATALR